MKSAIAAALLFAAALVDGLSATPVAIQARRLHTMEGPPIEQGIVLIEGRKITAVGRQGTVAVPANARIIEANTVTPGLIDAHSTLGLSGYLNIPHDQDQLERSAPMQPELRPIDAYNPREPLISYVRGFGVTTLHTGHGPGTLISGQTMVVKTLTNTVNQALVIPAAMLATTLGEGAVAAADKAPGTKAKAIAMLRAELIKATEYARKKSAKEEDKRPAQDLKLEALAAALAGDLPLLVTVHRAHDIAAVLRLGTEFKLKLVLDGVAEAHLVLDLIKQSGHPVILHPTMFRAQGETENLSVETASRLKQAGIPFAIQSGFEGYVPKTRVVLFEAALAAAFGLSPEDALASITRDAARILRIDHRVGSIAPGKDADLALFDGDPLEFTTHCTGVLIEGELFPGERP